MNKIKQIALIDADVVIFKVACVFEEDMHENLLRKKIDGYMRDIILNSNSSHYLSFLSPSSKETFRYKLAKHKIYKDNRKPKPYWFNVCRDQLIKNWNSIVCKNIEADDALSICQSNLDNTIICSTDKDLKQIPGWHYNFKKRETVEIDKEEADYNFWYQMLVGDTVDNIEGIAGIGDKSAKMFLDKVPRDNWAFKIAEMYHQKYNSVDEAYGLNLFSETYKLVYMLRKPEYGFTIPTPIEYNDPYGKPKPVTEMVDQENDDSDFDALLDQLLAEGNE